MARVRFPAGARYIPLLHSVKTGSGAHSTVTGIVSMGVKRSGSEADHPPPSNAEVNIGGATPPLHYTSSWRCAQLSTGTILPFAVNIEHHYATTDYSLL
jgi:hypothetical protein